ncbi:hypothetical protein [Clostridium sp. DJ247]|nr:hypothetical protein [Clostridium sp. DJ247]
MATIIKKTNALTKVEGEHEKKDVVKKSNVSKKELCLKTFDYFIF